MVEAGHHIGNETSATHPEEPVIWQQYVHVHV